MLKGHPELGAFHAGEHFDCRGWGFFQSVGGKLEDNPQVVLRCQIRYAVQNSAARPREAPGLTVRKADMRHFQRDVDMLLDVLGPGLSDRRDLSPAGRVKRDERGPVGGVEAFLADQQPLRTREELASSVSERIGQGEARTLVNAGSISPTGAVITALLRL